MPEPQASHPELEPTGVASEEPQPWRSGRFQASGLVLDVLMCLYSYIHVQLDIILICSHIHTCMHAYMYIYIYIYIHVCVHIYVDA